MGEDKKYTDSLPEKEGISKVSSSLGQGVADALKVGAVGGASGAIAAALYYKDDKVNPAVNNKSNGADSRKNIYVEKLRSKTAEISANIKNGTYWQKLKNKTSQVYKNIRSGEYLDRGKTFVNDVKSGAYREKLDNVIKEAHNSAVKWEAKRYWNNLSIGKKAGAIGVAAAVVTGAVGFVVGAVRGAKKAGVAKEQFEEITGENSKLAAENKELKVRLAEMKHTENDVPQINTAKPSDKIAELAVAQSRNHSHELSPVMG